MIPDPGDDNCMRGGLYTCQGGKSNADLLTFVNYSGADCRLHVGWFRPIGTGHGTATSRQVETKTASGLLGSQEGEAPDNAPRGSENEAEEAGCRAGS